MVSVWKKTETRTLTSPYTQKLIWNEFYIKKKAKTVKLPVQNIEDHIVVGKHF